MRAVSASPPPPALAVSADADELRLEGAVDIRTLGQAQAAARAHAARRIELRGLDGLDTLGAWWLAGLRRDGVQLRGLRAEHRALIDLVDALEAPPLPAPRHRARWRQLLVQIGKASEDAVREAGMLVTFVGQIVAALGHALAHPRRWRPASVSHHVARSGVDALPIIALMAVMISIVIGYQGVAQLRPYGGEDFTVNLVAVSVLREMAVLITAIMVAGRSGSAFTAEIGSMKARDEIEAMQVMGLDPMELLVLPRLVALVISLPLLTFFADLMGLAGGAAIAQALLQISPDQYLERVRHAVDTGDLFVGLVKAPVFAFVIAVVGCMHGLRVQGSSESVGLHTTRAVVEAIFMVIVLDGLFSILFERLGL